MMLRDFVTHIQAKMENAVDKSADKMTILAPTVFMSVEPKTMVEWVKERNVKNMTMRDFTSEYEKMLTVDGVILRMDAQSSAGESGMQALNVIVPWLVRSFKVQQLVWAASAFTFEADGEFRTTQEALDHLQEQGQSWIDAATEVLYLNAVDREVQQTWQCIINRSDDGGLVSTGSWEMFHDMPRHVATFTDATQKAMRSF